MQFKMRFNLPVEAITVYGVASPPTWVGALRDGAAINKVGIGRHVIVSAKTAGLSDESTDVVFFFKRHVVSARSHCVSQRGLCLLGVLRCLQTRPLLHQLQWPVFFVWVGVGDGFCGSLCPRLVCRGSRDWGCFPYFGLGLRGGIGRYRLGRCFGSDFPGGLWF